jgi:hypothetical protein
MDVPPNFLINDYRKPDEFRRKTFSGYAKKDVFDTFFKSLDENKFEESCQWCVELVISGYFEELWERLINYITKYIGIHNPLVPYALFLRLVKFLKLKKMECFEKNYLELRNNQEVRNLFCEIVCIIIMSTKTRKPLTLPRILNYEFSPEGFQKRLIAKNLDAAQRFIMSDDPSELRIIINEFSYNLEEIRFDQNNLLYWLSWAFEWEKINHKKNTEFNCCVREINGIDNKWKRDFIWIFWEVILYETNNRNNEHLTKNIRSLYEFFKMKYSPSKKKKRLYLIINAIELLSKNILINQEFIRKNPVIEKYHILVQACGNINLLYKQKKLNEDFQSDMVSSKLKQEATYVVTKYQDLSLLDDFPNKNLPTYLKEKNKPKVEKPKKPDKKSMGEISQEKFDAVSQIDSMLIRSSGSKPIKHPINLDDNKIFNSQEENKTVNLIQEIESKLNKKKKNYKNVGVSVLKKKD